MKLYCPNHILRDHNKDKDAFQMASLCVPCSLLSHILKHWKVPHSVSCCVAATGNMSEYVTSRHQKSPNVGFLKLIFFVGR